MLNFTATPTTSRALSETFSDNVGSVGSVFGTPNANDIASLMNKLICTVLSLASTPGLNVRAPHAIEQLSQVAERPHQLEDVYPELYTVLQAILISEKENKVKASQKLWACEAIKQAKSILNDLNSEDILNQCPKLRKMKVDMLNALKGDETISLVDAIALLDQTHCSYHERAILNNSQSSRALRIAHQLPFVWEKDYINRQDEKDFKIQEQRRRFEVLAAGALREAMTQLGAQASLTVNQAWLLKTAVADYDRVAQELKLKKRVRPNVTSPFYYAIKLMAVESGITETDLLNSLRSELTDISSMEELKPNNLQQSVILEKSGISINSVKTPSNASRSERVSDHTSGFNGAALFETSNTSFDNRSESSNQDILSQWENLHASLIDKPRLVKKDILDIFSVFDAKSAIQPESDNGLLDKAFRAMQALFDADLRKQEDAWFRWFSSIKKPNDCDEFMAVIAPKKKLPPYLFVLFCQFQINRASKLEHYEADFIIQHLHEFYGMNREKITGVNCDINTIAPLSSDGGADLNQSIVIKIWPRLNKQLSDLEYKLDHRTLVEKEVAPYLHLKDVPIKTPTVQREGGHGIGQHDLMLSQRVSALITDTNPVNNTSTASNSRRN